VKCQGRVGYADNWSVVLVLEDDGVIYGLRLPDVNECVADLASIAARRRCTEWVAVIQVECAVKMDDEEGLVSREDRAGPVEGLDIEGASLRAGGKGSDLMSMSVKKDKIESAKRVRRNETSCTKNVVLCSKETL
jgi:hypothetical protein